MRLPLDDRILLADLGHQRVVGIDHVADIEIADLGQRLVRFQTVPAELDQPRDQLGVDDARFLIGSDRKMLGWIMPVVR